MKPKQDKSISGIRQARIYRNWQAQIKDQSLTALGFGALNIRGTCKRLKTFLKTAYHCSLNYGIEVNLCLFHLQITAHSLSFEIPEFDAVGPFLRLV
jgi:hypothetical protein